MNKLFVFLFIMVYVFVSIVETDFSKLSLHQAKRSEMECQVKVLELENALEKERVRLASIRRAHYHLAESLSNSDSN